MNPCVSSLNLTTRTPIEKEELNSLKSMWKSLFEHPDSTEFREPVKWEAYGLVDYPKVIKKPMDLGTVQTKLNDGLYLYAEDMLDDIQLIWDNCKLYNLVGSWIWNLADRLEKVFKRQFRFYFPNIPFNMGAIKLQLPSKPRGGSKKSKEKPQAVQVNNEDNNEERVTYNDKISFSDKLKNLSEANLGLVVDKIIHSCPTAFSELQSDRVQILLENIDVIAFRELETFVSELEDEEHIGGSKKIKIN